MVVKERTAIYKIISVLTVVALLVGVVPLGQISGAAQDTEDKYFSVQVVDGGVMSAVGANIECSFSNTDGTLTGSGKTDSNGIWKSDYIIGTSYEGDNDFTFNVGGHTYTENVDMTVAQTFLVFDTANNSFSWADEAVTAVKLSGIEEIADIDNLSNGVSKSALALGLPVVVGITTLPESESKAQVEWNVDSCSYDPDSKKAQVFTVNGLVVLPDNVVNSDGISLDVSVSVSVLSADDAAFTQQPESAELKVGDRLTLSVEATAAVSDSYQWYKIIDGNESQLLAQTEKTLAIDAVTLDDAGEYFCKVTGENGNVISSEKAVVTVSKYETEITLETQPTSPQSRPVVGGIKLVVDGVPADYNGEIKFYVNGSLEATVNVSEYTFEPDVKINSYSFFAELVGDDKYKQSVSEDITFELTKGVQSELRFSDMLPSEFTYGDYSGGFYVKTDGGNGDGKVKISIIDEKYPDGTDGYKIAQVDSSGKITIYKAGSFVVTAQKLGDDNYNDGSLITSEVITVKRAAQTGFAFASGETNFVYNTGDNTLVLFAEGGEGDGDITYSVPSGCDVVEVVDAKTGKLKVLKSGTVTVTATKEADECYEAATAECVLTVEKADQTIEFEKKAENGAESIYIYYSESFSNPAVGVTVDNAADGLGYGDGKIVYSVVSGSEVASVNEDGSLSFKNNMLGEIVISAYREESDCYKQSPQITYKVTVIETKINGEYYKDITGPKKNPSSDWYTGDVTIIAPDGYRINDQYSAYTWDYKDSIVVTQEGSNNNVSIHAKKISGVWIFKEYVVDPELLKIDKSVPENIKITYENENWYDDILDAILFGNHENTLKFTVEAEDKYSGVSEIAWNFDADVTDNEAYKNLSGSASGDNLTVNGTAASATFSIEFTDVEEVRGNITVTVTDVAGWTSELKDAKKIIFDASAPDINMEYVSGTFSKFIDLDSKKRVLEEGENTARVYYGETAVKLSVKDVTFTKDNTVVKVNNEVLTCDWTEENGVYSTVLSSSADGVYKISLEATDAQGRVNTLENTVIIDNTIATIRSEITSDTPAVNEGVYTDSVKIRLYISEDNFNAENLKVEFSATDISGNAVLLDKDYKAYFENAENWLTDGTEYYAEVEVDKDAIYWVTAVYSDISGDAEHIVPGIVIDNVPAYDVTISYDETNLKNKISEAISNITSRYFNPYVDVIVTAKDDVSGVDYIKLSYTKSDNAPEGTTDSFELEARAESFEWSEDNKTATAVFSVPADAAQNVQLSGYFKAVAKDKAGNSSDEAADETNLIIVDTVSPECTVEYSTPDRVVDSAIIDIESIENGSPAKLYYKNSATLNIDITEANFVAEDVKISVSKDGGDFEPVVPEIWSRSGNVNTTDITVEGEGSYIVAIEYTDLSENTMASYESYEIIIDGTAPVISAQIIANENTVVTENVYYNDAVTLELSAVEENFRASDISFELLTAKDINGNDVEISMSLEEIKAYFNDDANWKADEDEPNVNKATLTLADDAIYAVTVSYIDLACNKAGQTATANAIVDTAAPDNITFEYSESKFSALINDVTFGYYNPDVTVTVKANDITSGVEKIEWAYDRADDASESNVQSLNGIISSLVQDETDRSLYTGTFVLPLEQAQQLDGYISAAATDKVGNGAEKTNSRNRVVVDTIAPEMTVDYLDVKNEIKLEQGEGVVDPDTGSIEAADSTKKSKLYFKDFATLVFKVTDINFHPEDINSEDALYRALGCSMKVTKDGGEAYSIAPEQWSAVEGEADTYTGSVTLAGDGNYFVIVEYMDRSHNEMDCYTSHEIVVDSTSPVVSAEITHGDSVTGEDEIYSGEVNLVMTVTEKNFRAEDLDVEILTAKDINGNAVSLSKLGMTVADIKTYFAQADSWTAAQGEADTYTASVKLPDDAVYSFEASYTDLSTNKSENNAKANAVVDTSAPTDIEFSYSASVFHEVLDTLTFGYYNPDVTVTVTAKDVTSGIKEIAWVYNRADDASISNVEKLSGIAENLTADTADKSVYTATLILPLDAAQQLDGHIFAEVTDNAENSSSANDDETRVIVDTISPTMSVEMTYEQAIVNNALVYSVCDESAVTSDTLLFSKQKGASSIKFIVKEINFVEEDVNNAINVKKAEKTILNNATGNLMPSFKATSIKPIWTKGEDIDTYIGVINFDDEGDYQVEVNYTDRSGNKMDTYTSPVFVIDYTAPKFILTASTGSDYYSQEKTATIAVEERAFRPSDFSFTFLNAEDQPDKSPASDYADAAIKGKVDEIKWEYDSETMRYFINFDFKETGTYKFRVTGKDVAGNDSGEGATTEFVIDLEAPKNLEISYEYSKLDSVINAVTFGYYNPEVKVNLTAYDELSGVHRFDWVYTVEEGASNVNISSESGTIKELTYSNEGRTATGSFYLSSEAAQSQYRGNISFTATDRVGNVSGQLNDTSTVVVVDTISPTREVEFSTAKQVVSTETLNTVENYNYASENGEVQLIYDGTATATIRITEANFYKEDVVVTVNDNTVAVDNWSNDGDVWTGTLTFNEDGHYIVKISYVDRSTNQMIEYVSNEVIVDTVAPVIKVTYSPDNSVNTKDNNIYYGEKQTATITITEHNFRASDVVAVVTATDVSGRDISVDDFATYLKNPNNWTSNGDNHTATITYSADANYTFDIDYTDLALRVAEDYEPDSFTVDTTPPDNLSISYSTSLFDTVINAVTFNYYNAPVTVTVSADDEVSGVGEFVYNYENSFGGNGEQVISESSINYSNSGMTATADFVIPEQALSSGTQFNGSVDFYATDRSYNKSETLDDSTVLVADNIAPQATITYNEPISSNESGAYYAGDITATITITEDNFYEEDVKVMVNGELRNPTNWSNNGNVWTGTVVISADGDYTVSVDYMDRSNNAMSTYESERLTIDRESPIVYVSGIKNESASNADSISFVIRAEDTNFNPAEFKPVLTAVILNDSGKFETRTVAMGSVQTVEVGKVYTINSGNIALDGVYTLTCTATDMSGNSVNTVIVTDSGSAALNHLRFSVNRNGSTFMLDDYTADAVSNFYVGEVKQNIVIEEINVDPLKEYKVELNGKILVEGEDYTVTKSGTDWNKYIYSVNSDLFKTEGLYSLVITSVDGTDTTAYSDLKNAEVRFVVDKTAPVVTVAGLVKNGRYQTEKQLVTIIPSDDGGNLYSLKVVVKDENGNVIDTPFNWVGEELTQALEAAGGKLAFEIGEGMYQNVEIICTDEAGNEYNSGETFYNVTVSPSGWVILWANPIFRISLFGGIGAIAVGVFLLIFLKKRKKDEDKK